MIRCVKISDAEAIARIYNHYVVNTCISFETQPISSHEMAERIRDISSKYPYLVYENAYGEIIGYCYVHQWKTRAAYNHTVETTVYCSCKHEREGIGNALMVKLIDECKQKGYHAMIACITGNNVASIKFHEKLGFEKVSHFKNVGMKFGQLLDVVDYELQLI